MISPMSILLPVSGAALILLVGLPWWAAAVGAVALWIARAWLSSRFARLASTRKPRIDPFTLREPWRNYVKDAISSHKRFDRTLESVESGPLRDRMTEIGDRVERGVEECWEIARKGQQLTDARRSIDIASARRSASDPDGHPDLVAAAKSEVAAHERLAAREDTLRTSLEVLDARLDEAVARASEMATRATSVDDLSGITNAIDGVVGDLESLRIGLDTVDGIR